ncbi:glyoxalase [Nocardiopsis sp. EMB25]|uniref:glyoxalase n=1 Tax=Nocardiopsis sp. EMB25 TaxID=2835867 RepID=UPI002283979F|nr:glyoxalase [Nocardiopsis sp. EMB25]MCY9784859.1 glyoxalase [Nocardiopsis sp. EMB25]
MGQGSAAPGAERRDHPGERPIAVRPDETVIPVLHCFDPEATIEFFRAIGFEVTHDQRRPYLYLALRWSGFDLHFGRPPKGLDPSMEHTGGCLVMVDDVAAYHAAITRGMREAFGKVLGRGLPRVTRYRPGASRFTLMDPSGNSVIFIQRDEPEEPEYGGSEGLPPFARALDNARILRDFKTDDLAASRQLESALRRRADEATDVERATALAMLVELSTALGDHAEAADRRDRLREIELTEQERSVVEAELRNAGDLRRWLGEEPS